VPPSALTVGSREAQVFSYVTDRPLNRRGTMQCFRVVSHGECTAQCAVGAIVNHRIARNSYADLNKQKKSHIILEVTRVLYIAALVQARRTLSQV
jgi:hypothetical protein